MSGPEGRGGIPPEVVQPAPEQQPAPETAIQGKVNETFKFKKPDLKLELDPNMDPKTAELLQTMWGSLDMMAAMRHFNKIDEGKQRELKATPEFKSAMIEFFKRELIAERYNAAWIHYRQFNLTMEDTKREDVLQAAHHYVYLQMATRGNITGLREAIRDFNMPPELLQSEEMRQAAHARLDLIQTRKEAERLESEFRQKMAAAELGHLLDGWVKKEKPAA